MPNRRSRASLPGSVAMVVRSLGRQGIAPLASALSIGSLPSARLAGRVSQQFPLTVVVLILGEGSLGGNGISLRLARLGAPGSSRHLPESS
jgi:hypothetical protein